MSKEKLTVRRISRNITLIAKDFDNEIDRITDFNDKINFINETSAKKDSEVISLLKQIRDEYEDINNGMSHDEIEKRIKTLKMFDKYLNEKGGK